MDNRTLQQWEDFYKYAESNIVGYKRPKDYLERVERTLKGDNRRFPARETSKGKYNENY